MIISPLGLGREGACRSGRNGAFACLAPALNHQQNQPFIMKTWLSGFSRQIEDDFLSATQSLCCLMAP
jgi:hypothetical protein